MKTQDKIALFFLSLALAVALIMGVSNVVSAILSTGQPVFLDQPWLAVALGMILPTGALALEYVSHFFEFEKSRKRYTLAICTLTALLLLCWLVLFALIFPGMAATDISFSSVDEPDWKAPLFTGVQTAAELFVSATLMLAIQEVLRKYSNTTIVDNPRWLELNKAANGFFDEYGKLVAKAGELAGRKAALEAQGRAFIEAKLAEFFAMHARRRF